MKWTNMVEMAVGLGAVSNPLKSAVINIFTMPYAAGCPSVLTPTHIYTQSHRASWIKPPRNNLRRLSYKPNKHPAVIQKSFDLKCLNLRSVHWVSILVEFHMAQMWVCQAGADICLNVWLQKPWTEWETVKVSEVGSRLYEKTWKYCQNWCF